MIALSPQACTAEFTAALVRRDMAAALALLTDDVVFLYSNGSPIVGKDAFAALMAANWKVVSDYEYSTVDAIWVAQSEATASLVHSFASSGLAGSAKVGGRGGVGRSRCASATFR